MKDALERDIRDYNALASQQVQSQEAGQQTLNYAAQSGDSWYA